jgi:predicted nucleic acid-binding protein
LILEAIDMTRLISISFRDALIVSSARIAGCRLIYTEDMQHGQLIGGVRVCNPFL